MVRSPASGEVAPSQACSSSPSAKPGSSNGPAAPAVTEHHVGDGAHVVDGCLVAAVEGSARQRRPAEHEVGPQALGAHLEGEPRGDVDDLVGQLDRRVAGPQQPVPEPGVVGLVGVRGVPGPRRRLRRQLAAHDLTPLAGRRGRPHVDGETEAVEELGPQLALLGVHRPDEHEPGGVGVRQPVPLDAVHARHRHVEQGVDQVVGEQVDLVDVEHAAVGRGQQAGPEPGLAVGEQLGEVERADDPVLGGAQRQLDEGRLARQHTGEPTGQRRLGRALVAAQQHAARAAAGRRRAAGPAWRRPGRRRPRTRSPVTATPPSPRPRAPPAAGCRRPPRWPPTCPARPPRGAARRSSVSAHGFDRSKNFRTSGSAT